MAYLVRRKLKGGDRFYVRYTVSGKEHWIAAGPTRRAAERVRDSVAARVLEGRAGLIVSRSDWSVAQLFDRYLPLMEQLKPRSAEWRRFRSAHIRRLLGTTILEDVSVASIERYARARLTEGASVGTINGEVAVFRHAIGKAILWKEETGLQANRTLGWKALKGRARAPRYLEPQDVELLVKASQARGGPGHAFLRLFLATGARPGELLLLKESDLSDNTVRLPALKGGVPRLVVVDSEIIGQVVEHLPQWTKQRIRDHWDAIRDESKIGAVRLYDVRHTVASEMLRRGATMRDVQKLFGHQSARMTERYAHFSPNASALPSLRWGTN